MRLLVLWRFHFLKLHFIEVFCVARRSDVRSAASRWECLLLLNSSLFLVPLLNFFQTYKVGTDECGATGI